MAQTMQLTSGLALVIVGLRWPLSAVRESSLSQW
jgi:hypothetical protein